MNSLCELNQTTDEFLNRHWPASGDFGERPTWKSWEPFLRGCVPNNTLGGCYALFIAEKVIYIGKGAANGRGSTDGIACRVTGHVLRIAGYEAGTRTPLRKLTEKWKDITGICTIGFEKESEYLAHALESFLIRELTPQENRL